ncbi:hypothetical protein [Pseudomonas sp. AFG_SD02_1510_Pfu_092]|uniref:hypothetical protein n=1 Tax=Pseudomonas sp. AFG_SD02_1510_Pfu_092 TaxID=2259497 RepID=UPI00129081DD|nr:hypothetical protein [Pseudomonas sp. AFG_SD02_1510_Pfu_092]
MNTGLPTTQRNALAITPEGTIVLFTEETRGQLYTHVLRRAAQAQGIDAMASRAIDTGEYNLHADMIQHAAADLADALKGFAELIGQMQIPPAA